MPTFDKPRGTLESIESLDTSTYKGSFLQPDGENEDYNNEKSVEQLENEISNYLNNDSSSDEEGHMIKPRDTV